MFINGVVDFCIGEFCFYDFLFLFIKLFWFDYDFEVMVLCWVCFIEEVYFEKEGVVEYF